MESRTINLKGVGPMSEEKLETMSTMEKEKFLLRIIPDLKDTVESMARKRGQSVTAIITNAIIEYIKQHREDI